MIDLLGIGGAIVIGVLVVVVLVAVGIEIVACFEEIKRK